MHFGFTKGSSLVLGLAALLSTVALGRESSVQQSQPSPRPVQPSCLLVDLEDEGLSLTSVNDGVAFDIDGDGVSERVAWPKVGSRLGFLALDMNNNGTIDSGAELIGSSLKHPLVTKPSSGITTILLLQGVSMGADGRPYGPDGKSLLAANGKWMSASPAGKSPQLESDDTVFQKIRIWRDTDRDGRSKPSELESLDANRILAVSAGATIVNREVPGALFRFEGAVNVRHEGAANGTGEIGRKMYEVVLNGSPVRR